MKSQNILLMAAFGLIMSALAAQAAPPTQITESQSITVPGNYVLANDIAAPVPGAAIRISASNVTLNLNRHTLTAITGDGLIIDEAVVNARVSNGRIVAGLGIANYGSDCLITGLNITVGTLYNGPSTGIATYLGQFNRVQNCVLTGQQGAEYAFSLFGTSHNTFQNCTLAGAFSFTISEQDQTGNATAIGDNNFSGIQWASPTE